MDTLSPESTISHYRVKELIARGGMGEVYKAVDTRLGRTVALKIPAGFVREDEKARRRFLREAHAAARLSHPNICTIFEVGEENGLPFIVMEFVEGPTVQEMLTRAALPIESALKLAVQIADALDESHRTGIIHRDLKPSNVIVTLRGRAMILDFGLAKRLRDVEDVDDDNPTVMQSVTTGATIIGTVSYMSPEQVRAKPLDGRSDIFTFGILLYEMLTGVRPFSGLGQVEILHAILHDNPAPPLQLRPEIGSELSELVMRTLHKDVDQRCQTIAEVKSELWRLMRERGFDLSGTASAATTGTFRPDASTRNITRELLSRITIAPRAILIAVVVVGVGIAAWIFWPRKSSFDPALLSSLETVQVLSWKSELGTSMATSGRFSSNGKSVVYSKTQSGHTDLWTKQVVGGEIPIAGTQDAANDRSPIFSPDDEQVAFLSDRGGQNGIWRIQRSGGTPQQLTTLETFAGSLVSWSRDGKRIYFEFRSNLYQLEIGSGNQSQITAFERDSLPSHDFSVSRNEDRIAYVDLQQGQRDIWVKPLRGGVPIRVTNDAAVDSNPVWHPDGERILYNSKRGGIAQICLGFLDGGSPVQLTMLDVNCDLTDISQDGTRLLYSVSKDEADLWNTPVGSGRSSAVTSDVGVEFWPDISSGNKTIAFQAGPFASLSGTRLTFNLLSKSLDGTGGATVISSDGFLPKWSPDGERLAFLRSEKLLNSLWVARTIGGNPLRIVSQNVLFMGFSLLPFERHLPGDFSWSSDGQKIAFSTGKAIRQINADGTGETALTEEAAGNFVFNPIWSPNGQRIVAQARVANGGAVRTAIELIEKGRRQTLFETANQVRLIGWTNGGKSLLGLVYDPQYDGFVLPAPADLYLISAEGGSPTLMLHLNNVSLGSFQLSKDGTQVAWTERADKVDTVQALNVVTRKTETVARSDDERAYLAGLAWSADSKSIYYSRHTNTRAISMIDHFR
jgi:serine/threonine protein kinase